MNSTNIVQALKISNINMKDIIVSNTIKNKRVSITYKGKSLVCQTPFLEIQDDVTETVHKDIGQFFTIFSGDTKHRINEFYQFIENIESCIIDQLTKNGNKLFTQKDVILKTLIRESDNTNFIKWPFDVNSTVFIDESKKHFDFENIKPKDAVKIIIEIPNLWIDKNQFGLIVIVQKIMVRQYQEKILSEYIFDDDDSERESEPELDDQSNKIISLLATEQKSKKKSKVNPSINNSKSKSNSITDNSGGHITNTTKSRLKPNNHKFSKPKQNNITTKNSKKNKLSDHIITTSEEMTSDNETKFIKKIAQEYSSSNDYDEISSGTC